MLSIMIGEYKEKVEGELKDICAEVLVRTTSVGWLVLQRSAEPIMPVVKFKIRVGHACGWCQSTEFNNSFLYQSR